MDPGKAPNMTSVGDDSKFHEQNSHIAAECRELRKALHELTDKGQIYRFLKRGSRSLHKERDPTCVEPREKECSTEIVATIADGYTKGITWAKHRRPRCEGRSRS